MVFWRKGKKKLKNACGLVTLTPGRGEGMHDSIIQDGRTCSLARTKREREGETPTRTNKTGVDPDGLEAVVVPMQD